MKHSIYEDCEVCGESAWDIAVHRVKELEAKLEETRRLAQAAVDNTVGVMGCDELEALANHLEDTP